MYDSRKTEEGSDSHLESKLVRKPCSVVVAYIHLL